MNRASLLLLGVSIVAACAANIPGSASGTPDAEAASQQAATFNTIATGDDWGNYGEQFTSFCLAKFGFDCNREGRDLGEGSLSSAQEIQQWDAEKNNPQSVLADIGIMFIGQAEQVGILADYEPPNVGLLPDDLHGPGWVATFVGVPSILANEDALKARGLPVPESWADLADPGYAGLVGLGRVGVSGSSTWTFVAMNLAAGGSLTDWQPGIEYGRRLLPNLTQSASLETFERGEVPISVRYDFVSATWLDELDARGVGYRHVIPTDGSIYAPSTLMMNGYDVAHHDFAKLFMEWVLTDEAQLIFAKSGARPIRSVAGDDRLVIDPEVAPRWLPDVDYANVRTVDWSELDSDQILDIWENQVVGGG